MNKKTAVIIDDIDLARATLRADIQDYCPEIDIVGEADGVLSGIKVIKKSSPDIIFLDIHLTDGEGFEILEILDDIQSNIIFTTASSEHAIQAFEVNAIDYLLKPVSPIRLQEAVAKCNPSSGKKTETKDFSKIGLHTQDDIKLVPIQDILHLKSDGNYTTVYEINGEKTIVSKPMKEFEKLLEGKGFVRTHQSHLIALDKVKAYLKSEGGFIQLIDGSEIPVSVRKKSQIVKILSDMSL